MISDYICRFVRWHNHFFVETAFGRALILCQLGFLTPLIVWMLYKNRNVAVFVISPIPFIESLVGYCGALIILGHYEKNKKLTLWENRIFFTCAGTASSMLIWSYLIFFFS